MRFRRRSVEELDGIYSVLTDVLETLTQIRDDVQAIVRESLPEIGDCILGEDPTA